MQIRLYKFGYTHQAKYIQSRLNKYTWGYYYFIISTLPTVLLLCSRSLFAKKPATTTRSDVTAERCDQSGGIILGWKLFGKVPPKQTPEKQPAEILQDYKARIQTSQISQVPAVTSGAAEVKVRADNDVPSTTALILQRRPRYARQITDIFLRKFAVHCSIFLWKQVVNKSAFLC